MMESNRESLIKGFFPIALRKIMVLALFAGLLLGLQPMTAVQAATLTVDNSGPCDDTTGSPAYCTVAAAVAAASPGDVVTVAPGTYPEGVLVIDKPLTLACANAGVSTDTRTAGSAAETIIDLSGSFAGVVIKSDGVTVAGCDIVGDAATNHGVYVAAKSSNFSGIAITDNFIHGMAKENSNGSPRSYGILGDAKDAGPTYGTISALQITGNEIYDIGGTATAGGFGISLHEIVGAGPGAGVDIEQNVFHDIKDDTGGLYSFGTAVSIFANMGAGGGSGGPSTGALVTNNEYADTSVGVSVLANDSAVSEDSSDFSNVPAMVIRLGGASTTAVIDVVSLAPFAFSNRLALLEPSFPGSEGYFSLIQAAIDSSLPNSVILVTDGVFNENVLIHYPLTLTAFPGANPIIDGDTNGDTIPDGNAVTIAADAVILGGFEIRNGFNGIFGETTTSVIVNNDIHDNLNIPGYAGVGLLLWGDNDRNFIEGNEIHDNDQQGILLGYQDGSKLSELNLIAGNTIYRNGLYRVPSGPTEAEYGIHLWNAKGSTVQWNVIYGHDDSPLGQGIYLTASDEIVLNDNDVYDNTYGVTLASGSENTYLAGNIVHDNELNGLTIADPQSTSTQANFNQFCRNLQYGVQNLGSDIVDAAYNWWGSGSGPGTVGPGSGDHVSAGVDFLPWDMVPPTDGPCHINAIRVQKYEDLDQSGDRGDNEPGLNGWTMTLYDEQLQELRSETTHTVGVEDGWALFEDLPAGNYVVCETPQNGWINSDPGSATPCKPFTITDDGRGPGSGPLFVHTEHPVATDIRNVGLGVNIWGIDPDELPGLRPEDLIGRLTEPWLCLLYQFTDLNLDQLPELVQQGSEDITSLLPADLDLNQPLPEGVIFIPVDSPLLANPIVVGVKTWVGNDGYTTTTVFLLCGEQPDVQFGNYQESPSAITLAAFAATAEAGSVTLTWETGTEIDNAGFNLYRATSPDGPWTKINAALIAAEGDAVAGASYSYADAPGAGTFYYQLEDVDYNGVSSRHGPVEATVAIDLRRPLFRPKLPQF